MFSKIRMRSEKKPTTALSMKKKKLTKSSLIKTQAPLKEPKPVGSIYDFRENISTPFSFSKASCIGSPP